MKSKKDTITHLLGLFGCLLIILSYAYVITADTSTNISETYPKLQALVNHAPIFIEYDENFTDYGFPGDGSPGNPYRIENYNITISGDYPILFAGNNTKHFVIQNCYLWTDTNTGIYLGKYYDMGEGTVSILNNNITTLSRQGIDMVGGNYSIISENIIKSEDFGIDVADSDFTTISENIVTSKSEDGIYVEYSQNLTISRNTCFESNQGINLHECSDAFIHHNNCTDNNNGMLIDGSYNDTVSNNILVGNYNYGIYTRSCYDTVFTNNLFQENADYGIYINLNSDNNILHHNAFINNSYYHPAGTSQAFDDGAGNVWYDISTDEGNLWDDWSGAGSYYINGTAGSEDPFPLGVMPEISEYSISNYIILVLAGLLSAPIAIIIQRRRKI